MATPTQCSVYTTKAELFPWNGALPEQESSSSLQPRIGPAGSRVPGPDSPLQPTLSRGTSNPVAGAFSSFTLKLNREDGDQFLGQLNFTMPPGLTANLHGITYCPEADIAAAAKSLGKVEQEIQAARPQVKSGPPTSPRAPAPTRSTRWQDLHGRTFPGRPTQPCRDHPGAGRTL